MIGYCGAVHYPAVTVREMGEISIQTTGPIGPMFGYAGYALGRIGSTPAQHVLEAGEHIIRIYCKMAIIFFILVLKFSWSDNQGSLLERFHCQSHIKGCRHDYMTF